MFAGSDAVGATTVTRSRSSAAEDSGFTSSADSIINSIRYSGSSDQVWSARSLVATGGVAGSSTLRANQPGEWNSFLQRVTALCSRNVRSAYNKYLNMGLTFQQCLAMLVSNRMP